MTGSNPRPMTFYDSIIALFLTRPERAQLDWPSRVRTVVGQALQGGFIKFYSSTTTGLEHIKK